MRKDQNGQILVLTAVMIAALLGAVGLAVDVGMAAHTRTELQKTADAMALAGVQAFGQTGGGANQAISIANQYGTLNGVKPSDATQVYTGVDCNGNTITGYDVLTARVTRNQPTFFIRFVGVDNATISACASAQKYALGGTNGIRPFALDEECIKNVAYGSTVVLKYDASNVGGTCTANQGNFSAVRIDGSGASIYEATIKNGSNKFLCAQGAEGCNASDYTLMTETGNMISANRDGINYLLNNTPEGCRTWDEVKTLDQSIKPACNPWLPGYQGTSRIVVVPVVIGLYSSGGTSPVPIKRFAIVFIEGFNGSCTGSNCEVKARFMISTLTIPNAKKIPAAPDNKDITMVGLTN